MSPRLSKCLTILARRDLQSLTPELKAINSPRCVACTLEVLAPFDQLRAARRAEKHEYQDCISALVRVGGTYEIGYTTL
jgi:hypothetical protein